MLRNPELSSFSSWAPLLILTVTCAVSVQAQGPAAPLITEATDETQVVVLHGNVHPLAQARYDLGAVNAPDAVQRLCAVQCGAIVPDCPFGGRFVRAIRGIRVRTSRPRY